MSSNERPLYAGLLVGGKSSRMGRPKQLLEFRGRTLAEIAARALSSVLSQEASSAAKGEEIPNSRLVILGAGEIPASLEKVTRLPDAPELAGPIAGLLAAHRWNPLATWILSACDHPWLSESDVRFLVEQRKPGVWAVMLRQADGHPYPMFAVFEPQALEVLERAVVAHGPQSARIAELFDHPRTLIVPHATRGLFNANTPAEFETLAGMTQRRAT